MGVQTLPSMSRCCSEGQQAASSSMSESHTLRLAVRNSLRKRGRLRARRWKHPVLLCRVGHQPRSNSSSILSEQTDQAGEHCGDSVNKFTVNMCALLWLSAATRLSSIQNMLTALKRLQPKPMVIDDFTYCL